MLSRCLYFVRQICPVLGQHSLSYDLHLVGQSCRLGRMESSCTPWLYEQGLPTYRPALHPYRPSFPHLLAAVAVAVASDASADAVVTVAVGAAVLLLLLQKLPADVAVDEAAASDGADYF